MTPDEHEALVQEVADALYEADEKWRDDITRPHSVHLARAVLAIPGVAARLATTGTTNEGAAAHDTQRWEWGDGSWSVECSCGFVQRPLWSKDEAAEVQNTHENLA